MCLLGFYDCPVNLEEGGSDRRVRLLGSSRIEGLTRVEDLKDLVALEAVYLFFSVRFRDGTTLRFTKQSMKVAYSVLQLSVFVYFVRMCVLIWVNYYYRHHSLPLHFGKVT